MDLDLRRGRMRREGALSATVVRRRASSVLRWSEVVRTMELLRMRVRRFGEVRGRLGKSGKRRNRLLPVERDRLVPTLRRMRRVDEDMAWRDLQMRM